MKTTTVPRPTDILSCEHRVIEQVVACIGLIADDAGKTSRVDVASAVIAVDFIRNFADCCHHGKEEKHLFTALESKGFSRQLGPLAVMLGEHEVGRDAVRAMADALGRVQKGVAGAVEDFVAEARVYVDLMTQHITKEDHVLFPMAEGILNDVDRRKIVDAFEHTEYAELGPGTHEKFIKIADELGARFHVTRKSGTGPAPARGCCHH